MEFFQGNQICQCRRCNGIVHIIKSGETLYRLSRIYQVSVEDIIDVNPDINIYNLQVGDRVCIPVPRPEPRIAPRMPRGYTTMPINETTEDGIISEEETEDWMEPAANPNNIRFPMQDVFQEQRNEDNHSAMMTQDAAFTGEEKLSDVLESLGISLDNFNKNKAF